MQKKIKIKRVWCLIEPMKRNTTQKKTPHNRHVLTHVWREKLSTPITVQSAADYEYKNKNCFKKSIWLVLWCCLVISIHIVSPSFCPSPCRSLCGDFFIYIFFATPEIPKRALNHHPSQICSQLVSEKKKKKE